jgi:chemotaxis protein CheD
MQGQALASGDKNLEYSTVLGSCVATCLYDPEAHVGGMNHFLLAEPPPGYGGTSLDEHYGLYLMELLINEMMAKGARKSEAQGPSLWRGQRQPQHDEDRHGQRRVRPPLPQG